MGQGEDPADVVIFFDANMPRMAVCKDGCETNRNILCKHRFNFMGLMANRGNLTGLSDWEVVQRFFDLIDANNWSARKPKPLFVIVTKDHNFIDDLKIDYFDERQNGQTACALEFRPDLIIRTEPKPKIKIRRIWIKHRASGDDKDRDLMCAIDLLNKQLATWQNP